MKHKKLIAFSMLFSACFSINAQQYDKNWVIGGYYLKPSIMTFENDTVSISVPDSIALAMDTPAQISDASGRLAFYSNGCAIANREHKMMVNGDQISPGARHDQYCKWFNGYPLPFAKLVLPRPSNSNLYELFHQKVTDVGINSKWMLYSTIDMSLDNGRGAVIEKNKIALETGDLNPLIEGVKHGNGRDWWVISTDNDTSGKIYLNLLTPAGVQPPIARQIEAPTIHGGSWGMACSPDGSKYAVLGSWHNYYLSIADFDRCTGQFSNRRDIPYTRFGFPDSTMNTCGGLSFSPNSRYLYVSMNYTHFFQLDTETDSIHLLGEFYFDTIGGPLPARFFSPQLAADGKIYLHATGTTKDLDIVHNPDLPAPDCHFQQYGLILHYAIRWLGHQPNYRLFEKKGSPCDSLTVRTAEPMQPRPPLFELSPNPASDDFGLFFREIQPDLLIRVFDRTGRAVFEKNYPVAVMSVHVPIGGLPSGIYFVEARNGRTGVFLGARRLAVER